MSNGIVLPRHRKLLEAQGHKRPVKSCPFCGSADINTEGPCYTQFMCNGCGASTYDQSTREEAFAAWNNRADQAGNEEGVRRALLKHLPPLSDDDEYNRVFQALLDALRTLPLNAEGGDK